jgi:hypothetical protein|tara:strand:- start:76 stop:333 length:258 start_codon:yes stop_codon:yes gene_type:complete
MSRIRASETLVLLVFLVFRVLDAKKRSSSGAEAGVAPSRRRRRRHGHRVIIYLFIERKFHPLIKSRRKKIFSSLNLGYHFLYKKP